ncbi:phosphotransferase [Mycobacterium sp. shizuoka-1]|uniref:aminoglycoside phosphotransferase family protein n=1 Tax=Mycobacterium sp. shizuoka-1 TaxID=2039281 RepID=UPI000C061DD6|nr:phosphotransferase [Mycobacterium sp. shizuoka-1]GAY15153.1 aminoglycoside phosphotransferase [Mycobacterium sp. shizuoka-1]
MSDLGAIPTDPTALTPDLLQRLIHTLNPDVAVRDVAVRRVWQWGEGDAVSTAGRVDLDLTYDASGDDLPTRVVLKVARPELPAFPLYRNEVAAYTRLQPWRFLRTPRCLGAWFDEPTGSFGLALEDLTTSGARFASAAASPSLASLEDAIAQLAMLHARYWGSRRDWSSAELGWAQTHVAGELHELFNHPDLVPAMIADEVAGTGHKRELVQSVGETADSLFDKVRLVQRHQSGLKQTLVHGDCHVGNTYVLPDQSMGFVDWQLSVRGYYMHDLSYLITTGLDVAQRRQHERRLIESHRNLLRGHGVDDLPTATEAFDEYRRAQAWNTYIGWLTCPVANYGWEINVANHIRLLTAYRDLDSAAAIEELR